MEITKDGYKVLFDKIDLEHFTGLSWYLINRGKYMRVVFYKDKKLISMSRFLVGAPKGMVVDHKNGNTLDNRRSNLRIATYTQNMGNRKMNKNNSAGYKGVYLLKDKPRYRPYKAFITCNHVRMHLGYFSTAIEAATAYNEAALKHFGEFAQINIL